MISVFLYRIDFNKTMRAAWSGVGYQQDKAILPLDLHYLLTPWAANAEYEHRLIELALQTLETTPMLTGPLLDPSVGWAPGEAIQVVLEEIATPDLLRIFDALPIDYKLSVPYVARVLSIESPVLKQTPPVTAVLRRDGRP